MLKVRIVVKGRVQGVGFRYFTERVALKLGITGWVRNTHDGNVEIEAYGNRTQIEEFIQRVKVGPSMAYVVDTQIEYEEVASSPYKDFFITF